MPRQRSTRAGTEQGAGPGSTTTTGAATSSKRRAPGTESAASEAAGGTTQRLADRAQEKVTEQVRAGVNKGTNRAADALDGVAQSLRYSSQQLREQDRGAVGEYVERIANRVEQLADYVQNTNASQMADRVERFARREPAVFLGGAFAAGLLGARFLKSSRQGRRPEYEPSAYQTAGTRPWQETTSPPGVLPDREVPITRGSPVEPGGMEQY